MTLDRAPTLQWARFFFWSIYNNRYLPMVNHRYRMYACNLPYELTGTGHT